jgi:hypothetical protein
LVLATAWPLDLRADARADLETGRNLFTNGQYDKAAAVFARLVGEPLDPKAPDFKKRREILQAARPVYAASLVALGRAAEADRVFLDQLLDDPFYEPTPGQLPEPVVARFITVLSEHREEVEALKQKILKERENAVLIEQKQHELEQKRIAELERMASEEVVIERRSRLIALAPFGAGQFQNGSNRLGAFFAVSQTLGVTTALASLVAHQHYAAINCHTSGVSCADVESSLRTARIVNWTSFGLTAALVVAGLIEAQVSLVPESKTVRKRPIPPPVKVEPVGGASREGAAIGLRVRF